MVALAARGQHGRRRVFALARAFFLLDPRRQPETQGGESMRQHSGDGYSHREESTVIFVGHARLPQSLAPVGASPVVSVEIEVDMQRQRAVEVAARGVLPRAEALLRDILLGDDLDTSVSTVVDALQRRYMGPPQRAMITAVSNAYEAYVRFRQQHAVGEEIVRPAG
jgi:hypothetical protein